MRDHVVVCGSDGLAVRVIEELCALGEDVAVVTATADGRAAERARALGLAPIAGDYRDDEVLHAAGVTEAEAVAVLEADDAGNLHAALAIQDLNPRVRLVIRFFNLELGESLERLFTDAEALSASAQAAPAFAHAARQGGSAPPVAVRGRLLAVREDPRPGTRLGVTVEEIGPGPGEPSPVTQRVRRLRRLAAPAVALLDRRTVPTVAALALLALAATLVFEAAGNFDGLDAFYFTITTITTTGYGDLNLADRGAALKLFDTGLMVLGALLFAVVTALVTDALVTARLARALGGAPIPRAGHAVVCGLGNVGYRVVGLLQAAGIPCVAIEQREDGPFIDATRRAGVPVVVADAARRETLELVHLQDARAVLAVTDDDLANLETALNARALRSDARVVLRLFAPELAERAQRVFNLTISRSVASLAAPAFVAAVVRRRWLATFPVGTRSVAVAEVVVGAGEPLDGRTVQETESAFEVRVLETGGAWGPPGDARLAAGDTAVLLGSRDGLAAVR